VFDFQPAIHGILAVTLKMFAIDPVLRGANKVNLLIDRKKSHISCYKIDAI